jgi:hypothetical protein
MATVHAAFEEERRYLAEVRVQQQHQWAFKTIAARGPTGPAFSCKSATTMLTSACAEFEAEAASLEAKFL